MGIADDMKNLGEDIVASYDMRVKAIGVLVKDTNNMLKGFQKEHKEMAANLKADLAKGEEGRLKDFKSMMADIQKAIKDIEAYVVNKLKEFSDAHAKMSDDLRKGLKQGETDRLSSFKSMMAEIQKGVKEIETYVKNKLKEFSDAHADMSEELKKELAKYVDDMANGTKKLMSDIQARQKERNAEVADLLEAFKTEREKMAANWQSMAATMAKRIGIKPEVEAEVRVRPVEEAIEEVEEEVPPEEEEEVEEAVEEVEEEVEEEETIEEGAAEEEIEEDLGGRILDLLEDHTEGLKMVQIADMLGIENWRTLIPKMRGLLEDEEIRKEDTLYFVSE